MLVAKKYHERLFYDYLSDVFPFIQNAGWRDSIIQGSVTVDGVSYSGNPVLAVGQHVGFTLRDYLEPEVDTNWSIVWQDESVIVVYKPALLPVHRTTRNIVNTLTDLVRRDCDLPEAQVMHRLDLETAGLVLMAKTKADAQRWQPQLKQILTKKTYHAIVYGKPSWHERQFTSQLVEKRDGAIRCQMHVEEQMTNGKLSTTKFKVLQSSSDYSVVECELVTGRKHQLRAHLAHLGHPIVGDKIYGHDGQFYLKRLQEGLDESDFEMLKSTHHLLVAKSFELNIGEQAVELEVPLESYPPEWLRFLESMNLH